VDIVRMRWLESGIRGGMAKKYWYLFHVCYCPVCGYLDVWKERIYNKPKPVNEDERYDWEIMQNHYCWL